MKRFYFLIIGLILIQAASAITPSDTMQEKVAKIQSRKLKLEKIEQSLRSNNSERLKSASAMTFLNKVTDSEGGYTAMAYSDNGLLLDLKCYYYDSYNESVYLDRQFKLQYDANGNESIYQSFEYDLFSDSLQLKEMDETTWNNNNQMTSSISSEWDDTAAQCITQGKIEYSYDGAIVTSIVSVWNVESQAFLPGEKMIYKLRANQQPEWSEVYTYDVESSAFVYSGKVVYTYNGQGNVTKMVGSFINEDTSIEEEMYVSEITYNAAGLITQETTKISVSGVSLITDSETYEYNSAGLLIKHDQSGVNFFTGELTLNMRDAYEYENNVLRLKTVYMIDSGTGELAETSHYEYTYEADNQSLNIVRPQTDYIDEFFDDEYFVFGRLTSVKEYGWDYSAEGITLSTEKTFHYSNSAGTAAIQSGMSELNVYPVPFNQYLNVQWSAGKKGVVSIYNLQGKCLLTQTIDGAGLIETAQLQRGNYIIEMVDDQGLKYHKGVIKK